MTTTPSELLTPPERPEGQPPLPVVVTVQPTPPESPAIVDIQQFVAATGGSHPYPTTREAFAALPKTTQAMLREKAPNLYQRLGAREDTLPASLRLKVMQGATDFSADELQQLSASGYAETVAQARTARRTNLEQTWLQGHEARVAARQVNAEAVEAASVAERERLAQAVAAEARARHLSGRGR